MNTLGMTLVILTPLVYYRATIRCHKVLPVNGRIAVKRRTLVLEKNFLTFAMVFFLAIFFSLPCQRIYDNSNE